MSDQSRHDADPDVRPDPQVGSHGLVDPANDTDSLDAVDVDGTDGELLFAHLEFPAATADHTQATGATAARPNLEDADGQPGDDGDEVFDQDDHRGEQPGARRGSFFRELPMLLVIAFLLAFLLRTFVVQVFYIPSGSMEPTLQVNDRMVVEKVTYLFREPERGEVVVFEGESNAPLDEDTNFVERAVRGFGQFVGVVPASARDFVKRVVGLPGDEILIEGGQVYVNGAPLDEPYARLDQSDFGPVVVPADSLFFLGDNRGNSSDSRRGLGFVPLDAVVGRSLAIMWPFDHVGGLTGVEYQNVPDSADAAALDVHPSTAPPLGAIWDLETRTS